MNRKMFRKLIREEGWTLVSIPRVAEHDKWAVTSWESALDQYNTMIEWCKSSGIPEDEFTSRLMKNVGTFRPGTKEFLFKHTKHASMFTLKWLT